MKLIGLKWSPYRVPFRSPFLTAHGVLSYRSGMLVHIQTDAGYSGNGEIAPLPEFSGSSLGEALKALPELSQLLPGQDLEAILSWLEEQSQREQLPAPLIYGLEIALGDALSKARGQNLATWLATDISGQQTGSAISPRVSMPVNAVLGGTTVDRVIERARTAVAAGFTCLKLKVTEASQAMVELIAALRATIGPIPRLRLDANEGWNIEQANWMLARCAEYDIQYVEQPLPANDLAGMAWLRRSSLIPLAADESLYSLASARLILATEAADVLILKPQLIGSLRACCEIIREARGHRVDCVITSTLETGIGVASALHLAAAMPEITLACGLATLDLLESDLSQAKMTLNNGYLDVPTGPGLGVQPDPVLLERYQEMILC